MPNLQINIAALRIAADKFDPEFTERRRVALGVGDTGQTFLTEILFKT